MTGLVQISDEAKNPELCPLCLLVEIPTALVPWLAYRLVEHNLLLRKSLDLFDIHNTTQFYFTSNKSLKSLKHMANMHYIYVT